MNDNCKQDVDDLRSDLEKLGRLVRALDAELGSVRRDLEEKIDETLRVLREEIEAAGL